MGLSGIRKSRISASQIVAARSRPLAKTHPSKSSTRLTARSHSHRSWLSPLFRLRRPHPLCGISMKPTPLESTRGQSFMRYSSKSVWRKSHVHSPRPKTAASIYQPAIWSSHRKLSTEMYKGPSRSNGDTPLPARRNNPPRFAQPPFDRAPRSCLFRLLSVHDLQGCAGPPSRPPASLPTLAPGIRV